LESVDDAGGELPATDAEVSGVVKASVLLGNRHTTDAAGSCNEVPSGILEWTVRDGEV
jgi:hypothetical protein